MFKNKIYWKIGKRLYQIRNKHENSLAYLSNYYSYYFGSNFFNRENIRYMKRFYLYFPIYCPKYEMLSWEHFKILLKVRNSKERNFYLYYLLFTNSSVEDLELLINNHLFERI